MIDDLSKQVNIGKDTATKLKTVGIECFADLQRVGTEEAFARLQTLDPGACLSLLCAIDGAIQGIRWHNLPPARKKELQIYHKHITKQE